MKHPLRMLLCSRIMILWMLPACAEPGGSMTNKNQ